MAMREMEHDPAEAGRLRHRRTELVRRYEKLTERVALFENPVNRRQLEELALDVSRVEQRLDELSVV
jgi:hypothetical protein